MVKVKQSGFTLIEVLVASAIFVMAITAAIAAFTTSAQVRIASDAIRDTNQGARFALEEITRAIQNTDYYGESDTKYDYVPVGVEQQGGGWFGNEPALFVRKIIYDETTGQEKLYQTAYYLSYNVIFKSTSASIRLGDGTWGAPSPIASIIPVASNDVIFDKFNYSVTAGNNLQTFVKIEIEAATGEKEGLFQRLIPIKAGESSKVHLETTVCPRVFPQNYVERQ